MSGHSKWANIRRTKEKVDAKRGKIFTKLGREIYVAVKENGSGDINSNAKLRDIVTKAKAANMPNETIDRNIKKALGDNDTSSWVDIVYEGYGPNGVAVIVEALTDNKNRTAADVRHAFDKFGGNMGTSGCVSWMFDKKGIIVLEKSLVKEKNLDEDELMMISIEAGAEDFQSEDECYEITTTPEDFSKVLTVLQEKKLEFLEAEVKMVPQNYISLDEENAKKMQLIIDNLEDNDDVQSVWHNWEE